MSKVIVVDMFDEFTSAIINIDGVSIYTVSGGDGPPLLLLHGFPETHLMWRDVAPRLTHDFHVVCADLRGYGKSSCPETDDTHEPYSKRAMAKDSVRVMERLGFSRFSVAGHDRGGRVAYRMALDHPETIERLAVLDIVPTSEVWDRADQRLAIGFWPWSLLAQPAPLPEQVLQHSAEAIIENALGTWGSSQNVFSLEVRNAYSDSLKDPSHAHSICEEYRAAASTDREHDKTDLESGRRIVSPALVLWSRDGAVGTWYKNDGGPLEIWRRWADYVTGHPVAAGHFFPEELPEETAQSLREFFISDLVHTNPQNE